MHVSLTMAEFFQISITQSVKAYSCIVSYFVSASVIYCNMNRNRKKKRGQRAVGGDKSGRGLRQFSMKGFYFFISPCFASLISINVKVLASMFRNVRIYV